MRLLLVQFNSKLLTQNENRQAKAYYDKLYSGVRPGYYRLGPTWEIPVWITEVKQNFPEADVLFADSLDDIFDIMADYDYMAFSVMDCNKHLIKTVSMVYQGVVLLGGYEYPVLDGYSVWLDSVRTMTVYFDREYKSGVDYSDFYGQKTIARLTMSTGCKHHCKFCTVPNEVKSVTTGEIYQQLSELVKLDSPLIYLNDKTFGQSGTHITLPYFYSQVKYQKPDFIGFIIQTTTSQILKLSDDFLLNSGIKYVELGIETYNDSILKAMDKPSSEKLIDKAMAKLYNLGIRIIPNIMIGLPGETEKTYERTMNWLWADAYANYNMSHLNIYNYVDYGVGGDENQVKQENEDFANKLYELGELCL